ncbi:MAG: NAD-glutamate dehydrogenase [Anaerolineae bacterium]|nr:NAD-glutamate dehydrogenase [Anaerolineae bacterium]
MPLSCQLSERVSDQLEALLASFRSTTEQVTPHFYQTMPEAYFNDIDEESQRNHLKAIIAIEATGLPLELILRSENGLQYTFINDENYPGQLSRLVKQITHDLPLSSAKVYTASDGKFVLDVFDFAPQKPCDPQDPNQAQKIRKLLAHLETHEPDITCEMIEQHVRHCTAPYILKVSPHRICDDFRIVNALRGTNETQVQWVRLATPGEFRITIGVGNASQRALFERIASHLGQCHIDIRRAYLDNFDHGSGDVVSLFSFFVKTSEAGSSEMTERFWTELCHDLKRLNYVHDVTIQTAYAFDKVSLTQAEVLTALSHLIHQRLSKKNSLIFTRERILTGATRNLAIALKIVDLFLWRFSPTGEAVSFQPEAESLTAAIAHQVDNTDDRCILQTMLQAVGTTLKTNVYLANRAAFSLRCEPDWLMTEDRPQKPFGVFFVHGQQFDGFHVRFRDIARGGIRIVRPRGVEHHSLECERLYDEAYNLAYAQQLKNKDIPEGGAKGVLLIQPDASPDRCGKAYADALLDLITPDEPTRRWIKDYYGLQELLYLGPDENISTRLICWIVERARKRGYPQPTAFMSSKPGAGINHKAYGVTSEGVNVFLEYALRYRGINPRTQPFRVKMTGGPDGDVAGNEIRILQREFGDHVCFVGIADGSGCAEDPAGLDHGELLRLVEAELPITDFSPAKLSAEGRVIRLTDPDGVNARNTLHNRLVTDAFIPAGGRPQTINHNNWPHFLTPDGKPSSAVIVEGANLFITPEARLRLAEHGVIIVKDSSANKCGVVCSSFEIIANMLLQEAEFLAIKEQFVQEVLVKLRQLAGFEAETLFREHLHKPDVPLPELSTRLSNVIIRATDILSDRIPALRETDNELTRSIVEQHIPPILLKTAGHRLFTDIPETYLTIATASLLASKIVYREGIDYLEAMPPHSLAELAIRYVRQEQDTGRLIAQVRQSNLPDRERIAQLLEYGGTNAALRQIVTAGVNTQPVSS